MTACDASEAMADLASLYIGRPVLRMSFEQVPFREHFDGVWACASLLHVPRHRMIGTLDRLGAAMKAGGAMYASFRYGRGETIRDGRLFSDHNEESLEGLLRNSPELEICEARRTTDLRTDHSDVRWLNALLRKRRITGTSPRGMSPGSTCLELDADIHLVVGLYRRPEG